MFALFDDPSNLICIFNQLQQIICIFFFNTCFKLAQLADVFIQHSIVDGKVVKTSGEWGKVEAVYEDYTVRVKSGDVFSVKTENSHFKTVG